MSVRTKKSKLEFSSLCDQLSQIKLSKFIAKGTEGAIYTYCVMNNCNFVAKVTIDCDDEKYEEIEKEIDTNNKAYKLNMAYKIHAIDQCDEECITIMDLAQGETIDDMLDENLTNSKFSIIIKSLIGTLDKLHEKGIYHGDTNPKNEFIYNDKIKFIDFTYQGEDYEYYYDFCQLFYYLPSYVKMEKFVPINLNIIKSAYDVIINRLKEEEQDDFLTFLIQTYSENEFTLELLDYLRNFVLNWIWYQERDLDDYDNY